MSPINGKLGTFSRDDERASTGGHGPVLRTGKLKANDGVYPMGLLLTRLLTNVLVALQVIVAEILAAGDGATAAFTGTLAASPIEPGTVSVTDGVETFADDGSGRLTGDAGGSGTIDYKTGKLAVTFNANVGNGTDIEVDYVTAVAGVLDEQVDTAAVEAGNYVAHGTVRTDVLKVGAVAKAAPSAAVLSLLEARGVYPV